MKNKYLISILAIAMTFLAEAAETGKKTISVPASIVKKEIIMRDGEIDYRVGSKGVYSQFVATHSGVLTNIRLVIDDETVYTWDIVRNSTGEVILSDSESGEHSDNSVKIDRVKWMKFFQDKVAISIEYAPERSPLILEAGSIEWEFAGYVQGDITVKKAGTQFLRTLKKEDLMFDPPVKGKFFIGTKDGRICPLIKNEGNWVIPVSFIGTN
ncbi:MAG: hypothetical protein WC666_04895 [Candidatus Paceibacterota bacterium]|jgi:hypothetical protein